MLCQSCSPGSLASAHGCCALCPKDVSGLPAHVAFPAVSATVTTIERGTPVAELDFPDVLGLTAANHVIAVPLLGVVDGPGLAA